MPEPLSVRLLGPFEVDAGARPVALTAGRLRSLLAALALSAGRVVPLDRLATAVWHTDLPVDARRSIGTYVTRLRAAIGAGAIDRGINGYVLRTDPDRVDALRFLRLVDAARSAVDPEAGLREALGLWRGAPFEGVRSR